ncbi:MAG: hypothetical protein ABL919_08520 [Methylococcales bacterium]
MGRDNGAVEAFKNGFAHALADFNEQGRGKWLGGLVTRQSDKERQVRVFLDLLDGFDIRQSQLVLDDHSANDQPGLFHRSTAIRRKTLVVKFRQRIPGNAGA